jgi:hypothetical protein
VSVCGGGPAVCARGVRGGLPCAHRRGRIRDKALPRARGRPAGRDGKEKAAAVALMHCPYVFFLSREAVHMSCI